MARPAIQERMQRYSQKEIRFTLLAIVKNRKDVYEEELETLKVDREDIKTKLEKTDLDSEKKKQYESEIAKMEDQKQVLLTKINEEKEKREAWAIENVRRKHNYIPFIYNLLQVLAEKGKLEELRKAGKKVAEEREKKKQDEKKKATTTSEKDKNQTGEKGKDGADQGKETGNK